MSFAGWGLLGVGAFLAYTQLIGVNPWESVRAALTGKPQPAPQSFNKVIVESVLAKTAKDLSSAQTPGGLGGGTASVARETIVSFAEQQIGEPYVFGAAGPNSWDCSGLTLAAYKLVGISLPHSAHLQQLMGTRIPLESAQPGDLIFWRPVSTHVAIYVGNGQVVHAPQPGERVKLSAIWDRANVNVRKLLP